MVPQKAPCSSAPRGSRTRLSTASIVHHLQYSPQQKKQKMPQSFNNNINSLNTTVNFTVADDRYDILAWLSPLNPKLRHQDIRGRRVGNVGEWVFQTEEFRSWHAGSGESESDKTVLFCYGDPGVGKTFIR